MADINQVQLPDGSQYNIQDSTSGYATENYVQTQIGAITKATIGLGNVDNTSDANKPVSTAQQTALNGKTNTSVIAYTESSATATKRYEIGDQFILSGVLYTATAIIPNGDPITIGTNCVASDTIADQLADLGGAAEDITYDNTTSGLDATDVQEAVDEVNAKFDDHIRRTRRNITNDLTNLTTAIAEQNLEKYGYAIGDYFVGASTYKYILADMDTYYGGYDSYSVLSTHHIALVVDTGATSKWHTGDASSVGYKGCTLHTYLKGTVFNNIKTDLSALFTDWSAHLLKHQKLLTTALNNWGWETDAYISAMTESEVYGHGEWSANSYQEGEAVKPLSLFQKYRFNQIFGENNHVWLRNMQAASVACLAAGYGFAHYDTVANAYAAVGLILFH